MNIGDFIFSIKQTRALRAIAVHLFLEALVLAAMFLIDKFPGLITSSNLAIIFSFLVFPIGIILFANVTISFLSIDFGLRKLKTRKDYGFDFSFAERLMANIMGIALIFVVTEITNGSGLIILGLIGGLRMASFFIIGVFTIVIQYSLESRYQRKFPQPE